MYASQDTCVAFVFAFSTQINLSAYIWRVLHGCTFGLLLSLTTDKGMIYRNHVERCFIHFLIVFGDKLTLKIRKKLFLRVEKYQLENIEIIRYKTLKDLSPLPISYYFNVREVTKLPNKNENVVFCFLILPNICFCWRRNFKI